MLRTSLLGALALVCASPHFAFAQSSPCLNAIAAQASVKTRDGSWIMLSPEQWQFIRGAYAVLPPLGLPPGDKAALAQLPLQDTGMIFFVDGDMACPYMPVPKEMIALIRQVGEGEITHVGTDN